MCGLYVILGRDFACSEVESNAQPEIFKAGLFGAILAEDSKCLSSQLPNLLIDAHRPKGREAETGACCGKRNRVNKIEDMSSFPAGSDEERANKPDLRIFAPFCCQHSMRSVLLWSTLPSRSSDETSHVSWLQE